MRRCAGWTRSKTSPALTQAGQGVRTELILGLQSAAEGISLTGLVDKLFHETGYIAELQAEKTVEAEARSRKPQRVSLGGQGV